MTDRGISLYPLHFEPIYLDKIWGWRRLEQLGRQLPGPETRPIGEAWELADPSKFTPVQSTLPHIPSAQ